MFHKNVSRRILGHYRSNPFSFFATLMPLVSSRTTSRLNSPPKFLRVMMRSRCQCWAVDWWCNLFFELTFVWLFFATSICHLRCKRLALSFVAPFIMSDLVSPLVARSTWGAHYIYILYAGPDISYECSVPSFSVLDHTGCQSCLSHPRCRLLTIAVGGDWVLVGILPMLRPEGSYVWHSAVLMWAEGLLRYMWDLHWVSGIRHRL